VLITFKCQFTAVNIFSHITTQRVAGRIHKDHFSIAENSSPTKSCVVYGYNQVMYIYNPTTNCNFVNVREQS